MCHQIDLMQFFEAQLTPLDAPSRNHYIIYKGVQIKYQFHTKLFISNECYEFKCLLGTRIQTIPKRTIQEFGLPSVKFCVITLFVYTSSPVQTQLQITIQHKLIIKIRKFFIVYARLILLASCSTLTTYHYHKLTFLLKFSGSPTVSFCLHIPSEF
ncbi:unnamed protein product [Paramecium sonneborni]|uniref:Uncharacterized protein n=1 Tax=Paramecium sonneborni TaxID=65129 RepID=A0A8S1P597_9CILI|nr:unnamed protein product [Paramecium sonneborni]